MKIACAGDAHGARGAMLRMLDALPRIDALCFLGDCDADADFLEPLLKSAQPHAAFLSVAGNNDPFSERPKTIEMSFGAARAMLTHGHLFGVKQSLMRLLYRAKERECDLALFGHTHAPFMEQIDGVWLVNPGALLKDRWALLEIEKEIRAELRTV